MFKLIASFTTAIAHKMLGEQCSAFHVHNRVEVRLKVDNAPALAFIILRFIAVEADFCI